MLLEYTDKTNSVTDTELLLDLQRVSNETGKQSLTIAEYKEHGRYDPSTIIRHFETWNKALSIAGLQISNRQYADRELFDIWPSYGLKLDTNRQGVTCLFFNLPSLTKRMNVGLVNGQ